MSANASRSGTLPVIITAVGPDNVGLADPIIHYVTGQGANIAEIQMYDHDEEALFAMLLRIQLPTDKLDAARAALAEIGKEKNSPFASGRPQKELDGHGWPFV